eukprot:NODE_2_length_91304_cov_0.692462.p4 type:complete len:890 gc:universal NODE_2_length_91304_cov_0.692462:24807-27476(+)
MWTVDMVRKTFCEYFSQKQKHQVVASCPVVLNDPTLLFTNAGMNPFKPYFLGLQEPTNKRVCNFQKCIRAGGKHNDLEDVGADSYHHTFFEMLGNWSFGDYFKKEAIEWAWDLLVNHYKLDKSRLYVTVYKGNDSVPKDNEAVKIWSELLPSNRILEFDDKDNFWEMGAVGPCGPCTEIHYDLVGNRDASKLVNMDDPQVIEIWNLVFIQYDRQSDGSLKTLPNKHVDTGMGLERLSCILQQKHSNYDIDTFQRIFNKIEELTNQRPYSGKFGKEDKDGIDTAYRVIADHIRTLCFAIGDQVIPSNEGRGYVLRRILRRGVNYARKLGVQPNSFFASLVDELVLIYGHVYPELISQQEAIKEVLHDEERTFAKTLDRGIKLFNAVVQDTKNSHTISGKDVFKLYDTFGFPVDLTKILAKENGFQVDDVQFEKEMELARERSRKIETSAEKQVKLDTHLITKLQEIGIQDTEDSYKYGTVNDDGLDCKVLNIFHPDHQFMDQFEGEDVIGVILSKSCCYAESGGQLGDKGTINADEFSFNILDTQKFNQYVLHVGKVADGKLKVGIEGKISVDMTYRKPLVQHHTATHILNFALRKVLGSDCDQKGSLVASDKLRFDFSYGKQLKIEELQNIEKICNDEIKKAKIIYAQEVSLSVARLISGLRAVFGEVYPDPVRVVSVGADIVEILKDPQNKRWQDYSIEFCGGTHARNSKDISDFLLLEESSIAKGVRRIIAVTGSLTKEYHLKANDYWDRFLMIKKLQLEDPELESNLKQFGKSIDEAALPLLEKHRLREEFNALKKEFVEFEKGRKQILLSRLSESVLNYFQTNVENDVYLTIVNFGDDKKLLAQAFAPLKDLKGKGMILLNFDKLNGKVAFQAQITKVNLYLLRI